jgi:16S rRNA processing protein RimM
LSSAKLIFGEISGVFGVHGAVKVFSFTEPRENILNYSSWSLQKNAQLKIVELLSGKRQGKTIIARLKNIVNREAALELIGYQIQIAKALLPKTAINEYYWHDLVGLKVETVQGQKLGIVESIFETGANDVLTVKGDRERLIPFIQPETVVNIDLKLGLMQVDWDIDF